MIPSIVSLGCAPTNISRFQVSEHSQEVDSKYIGNMENHWQTCSWSRHCTLSRHCLLNFGFGLVLCLTSGPKQNVRNTLHPLVHSCHQLVPSVVSTSEFWVIRKFTNCFSLMHTLETNMDAKNWWFSGVSSISCREYCIPHTPHTPNSTTAIFKNPSW